MAAESCVSIAAMIFGVLVVACVFWFGHKLYWSRWCEWILPVAHVRDISGSDLKEIMEEYLGRRNKFWELFGQVALSIVVVVLLAVLLLMDKIGPEAGLPILSALVAFVIGKGIGGPDRVGFVGGRGPEEK